jgi:hypothetical protein
MDECAGVRSADDLVHAGDCEREWGSAYDCRRRLRPAEDVDTIERMFWSLT